MYTFLRQSWWVALLALFVLPVAQAQQPSDRDLAVQEVIALDALLQQSDDSREGYALAVLYENMVQDAVSFPRQQTALEFQRRFNERAPSFGGPFAADGSLTNQTEVARALFLQYKEEQERIMFGRNMRFLDVYLVGKYLSLFMNGDKQDSAYDLFIDINDVQQALTGDPEQGYNYLPPRFSQGLTNIGRFLKGSTAQAIQIDPNIRNQRIDALATSGSVTFREEGIPVCAVPGVVQEGPVELDDASKKAVLGSLVDFEEATKAANATINNRQLLNIDPPKEGWELFLQGAPACIDTYCARLDFIKTIPQLAPNRVSRPLPLLVALKSIQDTTRTLSNTPLETKYVGRSMFSYTFANLNLLGQNYKPAFHFELRGVPIFQAYDARKSFNLEAFDQLVADYSAIVSGNLSRAATTVVNPDRLPSSQLLADAARQASIDLAKRQYSATMILRTMIVWNATYLKTVGDRLQQLRLQTKTMEDLLFQLEEATAKFPETPAIFSRP